MANERIGISELRNHASRWVSRAEQGHRIEITNRGRLVAMLSPASAGGDPLAEMERAGRVTRAVKGWEQPPPRREADASTETIQSMRDHDAAR